jgi:hypothetical protein
MQLENRRKEMKISIDSKELFTDLVKALAEVKNLKKTGENPHFKSSFVTIDVITDHVRPIMAKHNLGVMQDVFGNGDMIVVSTMIIHNTGQWMQQEGLVVPLAKKDAQTAMGAVTYARRYALLAMLNIVGSDEDDDGNSAGKEFDVKTLPEDVKNTFRALGYSTVKMVQDFCNGKTLDQIKKELEEVTKP